MGTSSRRLPRSLYLDYDLDESDPAFASRLAWTRASRAPVFGEILDQIVAYGARGRLLDIGCSFGFLLSMAKERGFEPSSRWRSNRLAHQCRAFAFSNR